jgi:uncharacterized protein YjbI with pentapeptide repeats
MKEKPGGGFSQIQILWNWLQFPVLALILIGGIIWLSVQQSQLAQRASQQQHTTALQIAHDQQQETLLMNYMNTISDMDVHDQLFTAKPADTTAIVATSLTLETLRKLDPDRKATLMRFLYETLLINNDHHPINMVGADISHAHLRSIDVRDTFLESANLSNSDLRNANLSYATLTYANLAGADLSSANLQGADLHNVNLAGANLARANLRDVFNLGSTNFANAKSLAGATMPDGTVHP